MLKFYVTCRPLYFKTEMLNPVDQLKYGFKGLDVQPNVIIDDRSLDGRMLIEITIGANISYSSQQYIDYKEIILEGLQPFSCHLKTTQSAKEFADQISDQVFNIENDSLVASIRSMPGV